MNRSLLPDITGIVGAENVTAAPEDLLTYAYDAGGERHVPDVVVFPDGGTQISALLALANRNRFPVIPRGAGSGLTGGAVPVDGGMVMVLSKLNRILSIDADNMVAVVEPGVFTGKLQRAAAARGLFYPPDPASRDFCTIGGNIAENAGGMTAVKYGVTRHYVMGLRAVLPSGEIVDLGSTCIKDVVGYDLTPLFVGSEGTLGVITRATLKLIPQPEARRTLTAAFPTVAAAIRCVPALISSRVIPSALEFMDRHCIKAVERYLNVGLPLDAEAFLLIEVDGPAAVMEEASEAVRRIVRENGAVEIRTAETAAERERLWALRRAISPALAGLPIRGDGEDLAVPRTRLPETIAEMERITRSHGLYAICFGHAGDGNLHISLAEREGPVAAQAVAAAEAEILKAAVALGGRIAAEHGIGLLKREKIGLNLGAGEIGLMRALKQLLDPANILNPGKIFPTRP